MSSISGGTDIIGCFALGNPIGPVYDGELQCRGLGMKVEAFDDQGKPVIDELGELVCTAPFPSMPLYFWNDPDEEKYLSAYFEVYPGDLASRGFHSNHRDRRGDHLWPLRRHPQSRRGPHRDRRYLPPGGNPARRSRTAWSLVRIGTMMCGSSCLSRLAPGLELTESLMNKIKKTIRDNTTPRHVPAKIIAVADIPYTINMKKVELAVRNVIHGKPVLNKDALANPEALDLYQDLPELQN